MKKNVGIITINDFNNFGNRLQNYALQEVLIKLGCRVVTIRNATQTNNRKRFLIRKIKYVLKQIKKKVPINNCFKEFNKLIEFSKKSINPYNANKFAVDCYVVGSDQVWNPNLGRLSDIDLLNFVTNKKKIAYAASFGVSNLSCSEESKVSKYMNKESFPYISVREEKGQEIIEKITGRSDIKVVLDPTMLLDANDWAKVEKKPACHNENKKYILTYFLGENVYREQIEALSQKNNYNIINLKDAKCMEYYSIGPSEFLYLFNNAELIFTDSFHACAFSIIYKKEFFVFDRRQNDISNMNSRIINFLEKFDLSERRLMDFNDANIGSIDYEKVYKILECERKNSKDFLIKSLEKQLEV